MSYKIEPVSVKEFVTDSKMKLPRFQRKATWKPKQNFELAISIFQDYPVGVVIINQETNSRWLLDGRQRRNALREMRANPVSVYLWAKNYLGFKATEDPTNIRNIYWGKVSEYLQKDKSEESSEQDDGNMDFDEIQDIENSFDSEKQRKGLNTLLDLILMVHQIKSGVSSWERLFDLKDYCFSLDYAPKRDNYKISPEKLREFIRKLGEDMKIESQEEFIDHLSDYVLDNKQIKFEEYVSHHWNDIKKSIDTVKTTEEVFREAKIGVIELTRVSPLDAQNIFSRINSGGTQLKAEELLSAKPFWNELVDTTDIKLRSYVQDLYVKLEVDIPENIVRWDLGATLLRRINDHGIFFEPYKDDSKEVDMDAVTLGFKYISSYFRGGMSAKAVNSLENEKDKNGKVNWNEDIDILIDRTNKVCEILANTDFFKYFMIWKRSITKLMGNAIVLEFLTILVHQWENRGMPTVDGSELKAFKRDAKVLFDRLVFEYASGAWKGSGDSKMANHIEHIENRLKPIEKYAWVNLIDGACSGDYNGQQLALKNITPILYYTYILNEFYYQPDLGATVDVDHIIPQSLIGNNVMVDSRFKDCLLNIALLPKKDNISKNDKPLNQVTDKWLKQQIERFEYIKMDDFDKYSDLKNLEEFKEMRLKHYHDTFNEKRDSALTN